MVFNASFTSARTEWVTLTFLCGELVAVEGDAVGKAGAEGDDAVALEGELCARGGAVHPHHAHEAVCPRRIGAEAHQCAGDGRVQFFGKLCDLLLRFRGDAAAAQHDEGLLRGVDRLDGVFNGARRNGLPRELFGRVRFVVRLRDLHVFEDIDEDGALSARVCDLERLTDGGRKILDVLDDEVVLGDGHRDAGDVDLLEGVAPEHIQPDVPRDGDDGDGIHERGRDAGDEVGGAGAARREDDADAPRDAGIAVCRVCRALFVRGDDVTDGAVAVERVVNIEHGAARIAENRVNALFFEAVDEDLCSAAFHDDTSLGKVCFLLF